MSQRYEAFQEILPTLPAKRAAVLKAISSQGENGATLAELVGIMVWPINRLSGRVSELCRAGYLRADGVRGRQTIWVACLPQGEVARSVKPRPVKAVVRGLSKFKDLFGETEITIRIPFSAVKDVALGANITVNI